MRKRKFVAGHKTAGSFRRLSIVHFLEDGEKTVGEVAQHEQFSHAAASYHLNKMHREEFVSARREGRNTHYRVSKKFRASQLFRQMMKTKK